MSRKPFSLREAANTRVRSLFGMLLDFALIFFPSTEAVIGAVLNNQNGKLLHDMGRTVEKYLSQCGRRWVELGSLFSFMKI